MIYVINQYGTGSGGIPVPLVLLFATKVLLYADATTPSKPLQTVVVVFLSWTQQAVSPDGTWRSLCRFVN